MNYWKNEEILNENGTVPLISNSSTENGVMGFSNLERKPRLLKCEQSGVSFKGVLARTTTSKKSSP